MTDKERMQFGLETVKKQYEAEIASDRHSIMELLRDPSILPPGEGEPVSYGVHQKFHHLGIHVSALNEVNSMLAMLGDGE